MNIVDSSGWLSYFADEPNAEYFLPPLKDTEALVVPAVTLFEVFKVVWREAGEHAALQAVAAMQKGSVADLTASRAIAASKLSVEYHLPMADSIILAAAREFTATIWTQDSHFRDFENVNYFPRK